MRVIILLLTFSFSLFASTIKVAAVKDYGPFIEDMVKGYSAKTKRPLKLEVESGECKKLAMDILRGKSQADIYLSCSEMFPRFLATQGKTSWRPLKAMIRNKAMALTRKGGENRDVRDFFIYLQSLAGQNLLKKLNLNSF